LSILDPLSGLCNRRFGEARLKEEIARALQSKDPLLVLLALDFDRFPGRPSPEGIFSP
jgi:GGDEF domain-containing protein